MKKLILFFTAIFTLIFSACTDDSPFNNKTAAIAKIKVTERGRPQAGITVCLFSSDKGPESRFFRPFFANKKVVTEADGIATFELQKVHDLEIINTQTTLYFGVFRGDYIIGQTAITIKKGETKTATIQL